MRGAASMQLQVHTPRVPLLIEVRTSRGKLVAAASDKDPATPPKGVPTQRQHISVKAKDVNMPPVGSEAFVELQEGLDSPLISPDPPCPYLEAPFDPALASPSSSLKRKATALEGQGLEPDTPGAPLWGGLHVPACPTPGQVWACTCGGNSLAMRQALPEAGGAWRAAALAHLAPNGLALQHALSKPWLHVLMGSMGQPREVEPCPRLEDACTDDVLGPDLQSGSQT